MKVKMREASSSGPSGPWEPQQRSKWGRIKAKFELQKDTSGSRVLGSWVRERLGRRAGRGLVGRPG